MKLSGPTCLLQCERGGVYALLSKPRDVGVQTDVRIPGSVSDSIVGHVVIGVVCQGVTICYGLQEDLCVLLGLTRHQVWPLTQFPFRQLFTIKDDLKKGFFYEHTIKVCVSCS